MNRMLNLALRLSCVATMLWLGFAKLVSAGDDWLPVPSEDLALKDNPASPGSNAMILYRRSHVDAARANIDGDAHEEYFRIKVFTPEGAKEESNQEIRFSKEESDIRDIRARTIHADGTVVKFDGQVYEKTIEKAGENTYLAKMFALLDVQPGSIVEYKYRQVFVPHYLYAEHWIVSGRLFTRDAIFSIVPYAPRNSLDPTLFFRTTGLPPGALPQRQGNGSYSLEVHNIPGVKEEPLMPPARTLQARVEFFYRDAGQPVGETTEQFWNRKAKQWSDELDKFLNKKSVLEQDLSQTVAGSDAPEVRLQKIYARVQKVRDLSYEPTKTATEKKIEEIKHDENAEDIIKRGYATGRQINWLFIGLARTAGFEASEVYLVPRNRDIFLPAGQDVSPLTADVVWVRADGQEYWLDPAALYYPFGLLPWYETEAKGVRVTQRGVEFVESPAAASSTSTLVRTVELELKDDGSATGKVQIDFSGQNGAVQRTSLRRADEAGRRKSLENEIRKWLPSGSTFEISKLSNWDDAAQPLHVEGSTKVPELGSPVGRRILAPIALFRSSYAQTFAPEQRVNAIYFSFRSEAVDDIKIHCPAGFKIESAPSSKLLNSGTSLSYQISASPQGDVVEVKRHFVLSDIHFQRDSYPALRSFFGDMKSSDEAQLVLENAEAAKSN
jgi:hypothetical protein